MYNLKKQIKIRLELLNDSYLLSQVLSYKNITCDIPYVDFNQPIITKFKSDKVVKQKIRLIKEAIAREFGSTQDYLGYVIVDTAIIGTTVAFYKNGYQERALLMDISENADKYSFLDYRDPETGKNVPYTEKVKHIKLLSSTAHFYDYEKDMNIWTWELK